MEIDLLFLLAALLPFLLPSRPHRQVATALRDEMRTARPILPVRRGRA